MFQILGKKMGAVVWRKNTRKILLSKINGIFVIFYELTRWAYWYKGCSLLEIP